MHLHRIDAAVQGLARGFCTPRSLRHFHGWAVRDALSDIHLPGARMLPRRRRGPSLINPPSDTDNETAGQHGDSIQTEVIALMGIGMQACRSCTRSRCDRWEDAPRAHISRQCHSSATQVLSREIPSQIAELRDWRRGSISRSFEIGL